MATDLPEDPSARPFSSAPLLLCFAVKEEAAFVPSRAGRLLLTGIGAANARRAVARALEEIKPQRVLSCGFAGGLNPTLPVGTVLFDADLETGLAQPLRAAGARAARFHGAARVAVTAREKKFLWDTTGADAVEMESDAIRQLCRSRTVPSATIRVISDAAGEDLPLDFNRLMTRDQRLSSWKLAWAILAAPGRIPALLRLQRRTSRAARELARVLVRVTSD
jgi:adenosylhomocysteine nucleosidase